MTQPVENLSVVSLGADSGLHTYINYSDSYQSTQRSDQPADYGAKRASGNYNASLFILGLYVVLCRK